VPLVSFNLVDTQSSFYLTDIMDEISKQSVNSNEVDVEFEEDEDDDDNSDDE
jgi:hypothetical protein